LLWGQDLSVDGAGERPFTDYTTATNADRRGEYLTLVTALLVQHLEEIKDAWNPAVEGNYRADFLALAPEVAIQNMLTGIGVLSKSELAGERVFTAYDNQDQEDEHSCFSDNTHRDIIANAQGITNVYRGSYTRVDGSIVSGTSLADIVAELDAELNDEILQMLEVSLTAVNSIPVPFDQAIVQADLRPGVLDSVYALQNQGDKFAEVASALDITISTDLPE
jgi:putative iron-regulated protein